MDYQFSKFLNMIKMIEVNILLAKALAQMPHYAKFMKDIMRNKRKLDEEGVVSLSSTSNVVIQKNLPMKMQDLDSFTIPCTIGNYEFGRALCDTRASINLTPLSFVKRLSLGELTSATMTLQMANITIAEPEGMLKDVLIKVRKFIFPMDFTVIDMEEDKQIPLLLGRPFLAIGAALIDVKKGELTLSVGGEKLHFKLNQSLKQPDLDNVDCKNVEQVVPSILN